MIHESLLIRTDANPQIGTGHLMRCLALAQAWQQTSGTVTLLAASTLPDSLAKRLIDENIQVALISTMMGSDDDAKQTVDTARQINARAVVVDGYHFGAKFQKTLKEAGLWSVFVDDNGHADYYYASLILNQNIYAAESLYEKRDSDTRLLLGTHYTLLRREFWPWHNRSLDISPQARKLLITMGGADPDNVSGLVMAALAQDSQSLFEARIVIGSANPHRASLEADLPTDNITLIHDVSNMPELMAWADMCVSSGGSTCWELAYMGLPALVLVLAENQSDLARCLDNTGVARNLGWANRLSESDLFKQVLSLAMDRTSRTQMSDRGRLLVDGKGARRVVNAIKELN